MASKVAKGKDRQDSQPTSSSTVRCQQPKRFDQSYGAMTMVMEHLPRFEQLKLQGLDTWWYETGVGRVQVYFLFPRMYLFADKRQILAVSETGECRRYDCRGEYTNDSRFSCQVGRSRLLQLSTDSSFRILKIDPSQRYFTIERQGDIPFGDLIASLISFRDEFVFFVQKIGVIRYSLAKDEWEELLDFPKVYEASACSHGDSVYVFDFSPIDSKNWIYALHNPGSSILSQEMRWQVIEVPQDVLSLRFAAAFVPLNSTEIAILGGQETTSQKTFGDVFSFNTTTCVFKKEFEDKTTAFVSKFNQFVQVCKDTVIVKTGSDQDHFIKYTKGASITKLPLVERA